MLPPVPVITETDGEQLLNRAKEDSVFKAVADDPEPK